MGEVRRGGVERGAKKVARPGEKKKEKKEKVKEAEEEEGTLASPGMPADHERCRYDGFTFYRLPTGRFTVTAPSTSALPLFSLDEFHLAG
ncbi:hypothetical protein K0M31_018322 [Melipona bicolor]|uniref:Uncharacterized protein n=1 Tax=Melipona bicolor TaxID=60889 RepID=A0AA40G383_9HYME|nr:hypothetical protein K0M31_018322 [Melipona bicolor]